MWRDTPVISGFLLDLILILEEFFFSLRDKSLEFQVNIIKSMRMCLWAHYCSDHQQHRLQPKGREAFVVIYYRRLSTIAKLLQTVPGFCRRSWHNQSRLKWSWVLTSSGKWYEMHTSWRWMLQLMGSTSRSRSDNFMTTFVHLWAATRVPKLLTT